MLIISRKDLAANLAAYGESEASAKVAGLSESQLNRAYEIGYRRALAGENLDRASCMAAVEVLEGVARPLRRQRRVWADVPAALLEPDPALLDVSRWFEQYAGGERVDTKTIMEAFSSSLAPSLPDFRYYKTFRHFRGVFEHGTSYIAFERGNGVVSLRFGVAHAQVERVRQQVFEGVQVSTYPQPRTISKYTPNMGPTSPHWPYPSWPEWPVSGSEGLARACPEMVAFVLNVALPYVIDHRDPERIRDTLVNHPGEADSLGGGSSGAQTVFAVDYLLRESSWLASDYAHFKARYAAYVAPVREALERDYKAAVDAWDKAP